jgi:hypothetical protein
MRVHWENIFALVLLIFVIVLAVRFGKPVGHAMTSMGDIGPGHTTDEKTVGLIALGFLCALIVAIVRILTRNK